MEYFQTLRDGTKVRVEMEEWRWRAVYLDGTVLRQFEPAGDGHGPGVFHRVGEIDQDNLAIMALDSYTFEGRSIEIPWRPGMKLIHLYRNVHADWMPEGHTVRVYVFGYRCTRDFVDQYHFNFIMPDGSIVQSPVDDIDLTLYIMRKPGPGRGPGEK